MKKMGGIGRGFFLAVLRGSPLPAAGPAAPGRAGGQAGLRFLWVGKGLGQQRRRGDQLVAFVSALEAAEGLPAVGWEYLLGQDLGGSLVLGESRCSGLGR